VWSEERGLHFTLALFLALLTIVCQLRSRKERVWSEERSLHFAPAKKECGAKSEERISLSLCFSLQLPEAVVFRGTLVIFSPFFLVGIIYASSCMLNIFGVSISDVFI